ncbi:MAG: DUF72 domain-containing protein [Anaerolineales bacterium]|nr:DUF72 domain-containing protein [Anaerolineales bacterium]
MLFLGCPMWGLKSWAGSFFPQGTKQKDFLSLYSRRLNTVEGNTTFYALPDAATVERWREATPPGFKFCLKFPQVISHRKRLRNCEAETRAFLDRLERLGDRCGPAFLQLPPTFRAAHLDSLISYLQALSRNFRYAVEPRHADFFDGGVNEARFDEALREHGVARSIFDTTALFALPQDHSLDVAEAQSRKPKLPLRRTRTTSFAFVRFVGQPEVMANRPWLEAWADAVAEWLRAGDEVFFFLHNPDDTHAPAMARFFHALVKERHPISPLPEWEALPAPAQANLL